MNWEQVEGNWKQFKGRVRSKWAKLSDDDVELTKGKRDSLIGKIQERYGNKREDVERQVDDWIQRL